MPPDKSMTEVVNKEFMRILNENNRLLRENNQLLKDIKEMLHKIVINTS